MTTFSSKDGSALRLLDIEIVSERLRLTPTTREQAEEIFREFTGEISTYMYPQPAARIEEALDFIDSSRKRMSAGENIQLTILARESGEFLGCCGLHTGVDARRPELGIWLKKGAHGYGYGREAIEALAAWAFENLEAEYLVYEADSRNTPSRKIPESLGGRLVCERTDEGRAGNHLDLLAYRLDAPD